MSAPRTRVKSALCGTRSGYKRHRRLREDACAVCRMAHAEYAAQHRQAGRPQKPPPQCQTCTNPVRPGNKNTRYCEACHRAIRQAHSRNRNHKRRIAELHTDITTEYELHLRSQAHTCPLCGVHMTDTWQLPNSKELDHIIPINVGGTHTMGNVRIICRSCNLARPHDGSDYTGQPTLWSQDPVIHPPKLPKLPKNAALCQCGQPLPPSRRAQGNRICHTCLPPQPQRYRGIPLTGDQRRDRAKQAATLRQAGTKWREIAEQLGFANEAGAYLAATRAASEVATPWIHGYMR